MSVCNPIASHRNGDFSFIRQASPKDTLWKPISAFSIVNWLRHQSDA